MIQLQETGLSEMQPIQTAPHDANSHRLLYRQD
jgi:hypothetical protein